MVCNEQSYPAELRERAVRMVAEVAHEDPSERTALGSVADELGIRTVQALLNLIQTAQSDVGEWPGMTNDVKYCRSTPVAAIEEHTGGND